MSCKESAPYNVDMDQDTARGLAEQGGTVLMLEVPAGSQIGVDHQAFAAGPKFKGIKLLPPGPHFFSCRALGASGDVAPPTGVFVHLAPRQVLVKLWDKETEQLLDIRDADEAERYVQGVRRFDFDQFLAPYDLTSFGRWSGLSQHISAETISSLSPVGNCGNISIMSEAEDFDLMSPKTEAERQLVKQLQEGRARMAEKLSHDQGGAHPAPAAQSAAAGEAMEVERGDRDIMPVEEEGRPQPPPQRPDAASSSGRCFYTRLPTRLVKQQGLSAAELTAMNLDKSAVLLAAAGQRYGGSLEGLLGELQFAFVSFVYGQSLDGFSQWKAILMLMLGCEDAALRTHQAHFTELMRVVRLQLQVSLGEPSGAGGERQQQESPFGLPMVEELLPDSFLRKMFGSFFRMLQENNGEVGNKMQREVQVLKQLLRSRLGWEYDIRVIGGDDDDEEDEEEDDLPVIVDTEEPYAF